MSKKKPAEVAVSLLYDGDRAPTVTAKGEGQVAQDILEIARRHEVPIYQNAPLTSLLSKVDLNMEVPESLYIVVAEIIAFAYRLKDQQPENFSPKPEPETVITPDADDITGETLPPDDEPESPEPFL